MNAGNKVVCIDGKFEPAVAAMFTSLPVEGKTYVIRSVHLGLTPSQQGKPRHSKTKLLLIGLINPCANDGKEHGFNAERFRLLDEMKSAGTKLEISELYDVGVNDGDVRIYEPKPSRSTTHI